MLSYFHIQPGWETSVAKDRINYVNCGFADQLYSIFILKKYGVESCLEDRLQEFLLLKRIQDLTLLYDPTLCPVFVCGDAPCGVEAELLVFSPLSCPAPRNPYASIVVPPPADCPVVTTIRAVITFQSPN